MGTGLLGRELAIREAELPKKANWAATGVAASASQSAVFVREEREKGEK